MHQLTLMSLLVMIATIALQTMALQPAEARHHHYYGYQYGSRYRCNNSYCHWSRRYNHHLGYRGRSWRNI